MKRAFYILLCTLPLLAASCNKSQASYSSDGDGAYDFLIFIPTVLVFGPDGGSQRMLASGDLAYISLDRLDQTPATEIYGKPCHMDIMYGHSEQYPVVGDFGACTVTVEPGCEYGTLVLSGLAYDGSANSYLAPGGFTITVDRATP